MITVTKEEFFNFIKSQPNDRELDFSECNSDCKCGCPMIQYAKEVFVKNSNVYVGYYGWSTKIPLISSSSFIVTFIPFASFEDGINFSSFCFFDEDYLGETVTKTTYGKLKAYLSQKHPDFNWN